MTIILAIILVCIICIMAMSLRKKTTVTIMSFDGKYFMVANRLDAQTAADTLSNIQSKIHTLVDYIVEHRMLDQYQIRDELSYLMSRRNIGENCSRKENETSFYDMNTRKIKLCLRSSTNDIHDINTLLFVTIHELTHALYDDQDHDYFFWVIFRQLLRIAYSVGIINLIDYSKHPTRYCGIVITYNPAFDRTIV